MKVSVTQAHIDNGKVCDCSACPVALGALDAGLTVEQLDTMWEYVVNAAPEIVMEWVLEFDCGYNVIPFEFELPDALLNQQPTVDI